MNSWIDTTSALSTSIRFCLKREIFPSSLVLRPLVSLFVSKGDFPLRINLSSTRIRFCFKREIFPFGLVFHPYVSVFVWKGRFFSSSLVFRPHVSVFVWRGRLSVPFALPSTRLSGENVHQKRTFSKTPSRVEIFENATLLYSCG